MSLIPNIFHNRRNGSDDDGDEELAASPGAETLPTGAAAGSLPQPIAGSEADEEMARPKASLLEQRNEEHIARAREERARFMEGDIKSHAEEEKS